LLIPVLFLFPLSNQSIHASFQSGINNPIYACYRDSASIYQSIQSLVDKYPDLVEVSPIGDSWEGQPIQAIKLTNQFIDEPKPRLVLISGLRANAFAPVELNLRFAEDLLANHENDEKDDWFWDWDEDNTCGDEPCEDNTWLLNFFEVHIIPLANPDGRLIAEAEAALDENAVYWQNNTHNSCSSSNNGVRLTNNFPYEWKQASNGPCDPIYEGSDSGSEPETHAIMEYLTSLQSKEPILLLHLDVYENAFYLPYLFNPSAENPHSLELYTLAKKIAYGTLSDPKKPEIAGIRPSHGNLIDYSFGELAIPSLIFSMGNFRAGEYASYCNYYNEYLLENNLKALYRAVKVSVAPYKLAYGPEIEIDKPVRQDDQLIINGTADDAKSWYGAAEIHSPIEEVTFSLDLPPWHPDAEPVLVSNLTTDPTDKHISHFSLTLNIEELSLGKHRIFFQAWDTEVDGYESMPGLISVRKFNVSEEPPPTPITPTYQIILPFIRKD
jgi:hypothetical protein